MFVPLLIFVLLTGLFIAATPFVRMALSKKRLVTPAKRAWSNRRRRQYEEAAAYTPLITFEQYYAWYPVKAVCGTWVWRKWIYKVTDERPVEYLGLLAEIDYYLPDNLQDS